MITSSLLTETLKISNEKALLWAPILAQTCEQFNITSKNAIAMFIAQCAHESANFTRLVENLNYSSEGLAATWPSRFKNPDGTPNALAKSLHRKPEMIANVVYANRMGNGSIESGEGWKFSGRGLIQLTFKNNYINIGNGLKLDLVNHPELLEIPKNAASSAAFYWNSKNITPSADKGDILAVTKLINGGTIGLKERTELFEKIKKAL